MAKGGREQRVGSSPDEQQERVSTGGVDFEDSTRRVRSAGSESPEDEINKASAHVDRELTDEELLEVWESTISGVKDGSIRMFDDKDTLIRSVLGRLGR